MAEYAAHVLKVDVDSPIKDLGCEFGLAFGAQRRVERHERDFVAEALDRHRHVIVTHAAAAIHSAGPGGENADFHIALRIIAGF